MALASSRKAATTEVTAAIAETVVVIAEAIVARKTATDHSIFKNLI